jgi:hypothetical protein
MRRTAALALAALAVSLGTVGTAWAITGGELDGNAHPNVAMIVFYQPDGRFRCSATLVSETVLVTAAHCTDGPWQGRGDVRQRCSRLAPCDRRPG